MNSLGLEPRTPTLKVLCSTCWATNSSHQITFWWCKDRTFFLNAKINHKILTQTALKGIFKMHNLLFWPIITIIVKYFIPLCSYCKIADIRKCFSRVLNRECGSFQNERIDEQALISCVVCDYALFVYIPHTIQVWGIASFIFIRVIPQPSIQ